MNLRSGRRPSTLSTPIGSGIEMDSGSLNRSCEPCRTAKVRCQFESDATGSKCQRCQITNRNCVFIARLPRKPRKRTDTRIKELEQKLQAMESSLLKPPTHAGAQSWSVVEGSSPASRSRTSRGSRTSKSALEALEPPGDNHAARRRRSSTKQSTRKEPSSDDSSSEVQEDAVSRGLISPAEAEGLFGRFVNHYMREYPLVVFPAGTTSEDVRTSSPTLFLAVPTQVRSALSTSNFSRTSPTRSWLAV